MARVSAAFFVVALGLLALSNAQASMEDVALVQGAMSTRLLPAKASGEDISLAAGAAAAKAAAQARYAAAEKAAAASMASARDRTAAAEKAEASGSAGLDAIARQVKMAKQQLGNARKVSSQMKKKLRLLKKENETSLSKLNRSLTKGQLFARRAMDAQLKEAERAGLKGKHVHLDVKTYWERIKKGNMSSYGLWTASDEKQHYWEKTWDILSNHIFGLDKLCKNIWNKTEFKNQVQKYAKYEKFFSARLAAAGVESQEAQAALDKAEKEIDQAEVVLAQAAEAKTATAAQRKKAREELAKAKSDRMKANAQDAAAEEAEAKRAAMVHARDEPEEEDVGTDQLPDADFVA